LRSGTPTHCHRCVEADPVVRACVIPSLSRNCIAISAQARIGSSSTHFTSIALSPCSTRKWAALVCGGPSLRGLPAGGGGACPVVAIAPPGCGGGEGTVPGADGRDPLAVAAVARRQRSQIASLQRRNIGLTTSTLFSLDKWQLRTPPYQQRHPVRVPVREPVNLSPAAASCRACRWAAWT
jgi:hypothetical protein